MTPPISEIERLTGIKPIRQPGALHLLNENYFKRIKAMEFAVNTMTERSSWVSRSRCRFARRIPNFQNAFELVLANKNLKVANLPLIPSTYSQTALGD